MSKYHANVDMGYEIEPFNLKEERRNGNFHANGSYTFRGKASEKSKVTDAWMDDVNKRNITSVQTLSKNISKRNNTVEGQLHLWNAVYKLMTRGETVKNTIQRLSGKQKRKKDRFDISPKKNITY